ncbi:MAG: hypothetical protein D4R73_09085 [Deltaproteobacteria bacterium]|nr:MAG: hypothetical protein D4R73_09085 [Deltaproteobacteria bacterium]
MDPTSLDAEEQIYHNARDVSYAADERYRDLRGLSDVLNQATQTKERIAPNRRGNAVSALVSMEDLCLLQVLEDKLDNEAAEIAAL